VARRKVGRSVAREGRSRWWWLALPALGVAAWAAFDATLGLVSTEEQAPAPLLDAPRAASPDPAALAPPEAVAPVAAEAVAPGATLEPIAAEPTATPAARAAAGDGGKRAGKRKAAPPQEELTEQDRRALERILERATEQGKR